MTEIKKLPHSHVGFTLSFTQAEWNTAWDKAIEEASKHVKISGFRPGRAPATVVVEKVGQDALRNEALSHGIMPLFAKFVKEHNLQTVAMPKVAVSSWEPLPIVEIEVAILPEVDLKSTSKIKVKRTPVNIKDTDVEEAIKSLKKRFISFSSSTQPSAEGFRLEIDFEGKDKDGVALDGTFSKNHPVILGEGQLMPDFEKNLYGKKVGEEFEFTMTFPKDYHGKLVAGKDVTFKVKVNKIEAPVAPSDDELGKKIFGADLKYAEVQKKVREDLEREATQQSENKAHEEIFDKLIEACKFELPEELTEDETYRLNAEQERNLSSRGIKLEDYLKYAGLTPEKHNENVKQIAEKHVRVRLILDTLRQQTKLELTQEEKDAIQTDAERLPEKHRPDFISYRENSLLLGKLLAPFIS